MSRPQQEKIDYKDGVLYVHTFPRHCTKQCLNLSPFGIKLETWLRMRKIEYEIVETLDFKLSPTLQFPFIQYNGQTIADSDFIIDFLSKERGIDDSAELTDEQKGMGRAITKMNEDSLSYTLFHLRYVLYMDKFSKIFRLNPNPQVDAAIKDAMSKGIGQRLRAVGISRKKEEDVVEMGKKDVLALSQCLGEKKFFMGDAPNKVDCSVFGMLSQIMVKDFPYPHREVLEGPGKNLVDFVQRMNTLFWPDYDDIVDNGVFDV